MTTHGESYSRRYKAWQSMLDRCCNARHRQWAYYGGRGITVCKRWHKFENFRDDMGEHPGKGWTLDRWPDNDGNYEPTNCRWATYKMQNDNRRPIKLTPDQVSAIRTSLGTQRELGRRFGVSHTTIYQIKRYKRWAA